MGCHTISDRQLRYNNVFVDAKCFFIMAKKLFERTSTKLVAITLLFVLILLASVPLPLWIVKHMYQTMTIKVIIVVAIMIWGLGTMIGLWSRWNYTSLWRNLFNEQRKKAMERSYASDDDYQALKAKYPISVKRHELHYRKHYPHMKSSEIIAKALQISEDEWQKREDFHLQNREERQALREQKSPTLYKKTDSGQRL